MEGNPSCELCFPRCMGMLHLFHPQSSAAVSSVAQRMLFQGDIEFGDLWSPGVGVFLQGWHFDSFSSDVMGMQRPASSLGFYRCAAPEAFI